MIILDLGGGNATRNSRSYVKKIIDSIPKTNKNIILKFQLFKNMSNLVPLKWSVFRYAYKYARKRGYQVTSSIFDQPSLHFLLRFDTPFIKIACLQQCYDLISEIPSNRDLIVSVDNFEKEKELEDKYIFHRNIDFLYCLREYPANENKYRSLFGPVLHYGISDHAVGMDLYERYKPAIWEKHYVLKHDLRDPYGDDFCITPEELKEIL